MQDMSIYTGLNSSQHNAGNLVQANQFGQMAPQGVAEPAMTAAACPPTKQVPFMVMQNNPCQAWAQQAPHLPRTPSQSQPSSSESKG